MKYKMIFSYDGSKYSGYAIQKNEDKTIQATIEKSLSLILSKDTKIYASGRTDKGVHALNQVATFESNEEINPIKVLNSLNKLTPNDIYFKKLLRVSNKFDARLSAKSKTYLYIINMEEYDPFRRQYEVVIPNLDIDKMSECAKIFIGKHCFQNYTSRPKDLDNFIREIYSIKFLIKAKHLYIEFSGNGFMTYMVRKIVGSLIEVGKGKFTKEECKYYLESKERKIINFTAIPKALYLKKVTY